MLSMEFHQNPEMMIFLFFFFSTFHHFNSSAAYVVPDKYFINCGSSSNEINGSQTFMADTISNYGFSFGGSGISVAKDNTNQLSNSRYQTARTFKSASHYEFDISEKGIYVLRLHFYAFSSSLKAAEFNVSSSDQDMLLPFFKVPGNSFVLKEFFLPLVTPGKFRIYFVPTQNSSSPLAFINAIEVFLFLDNFTDVDKRVTASTYQNFSISELKSQVLQTAYRINFGEAEVPASGDYLWRTWVSDDPYLSNEEAADNFKSDNTLIYSPGFATQYDAPEAVYKSGKRLNKTTVATRTLFNLTWAFNVSKSSTYVVRVHICDVVAEKNATVFNLSIYDHYTEIIDTYSYKNILSGSSPFYIDYVVDSDDSGVMNISIGNREDSYSRTAFLNGLEIWEMIDAPATIPLENSSKSHVNLIVGCLAGGVALIVIVVAVFLCRLKKKNNRKPNSVGDVDLPLMSVTCGGIFASLTSTTTTENSNKPGTSLGNLNLALRIPFDVILHVTNNFDEKLLIGKGGFGNVYKGVKKNGEKVAVKRSNQGHGQGLFEFQTEITILSSIRHRHLVSLVGYCDENGEMILVYDFMEKGTLRGHLCACAENVNEEGSLKPVHLSWEQRLEICIGSAKGLHYLHTGLGRGIIHRDVKSTNILLDENYVAKVADFGLSRSGQLDQTPVSTAVKGTFGYIDPEYFNCLQLTEKSDVYSFGVVLLEVLCARQVIDISLPREQMNLADWGLFCLEKGQLLEIVDPTIVEDINPNSLKKFGEIIGKCLRESGSDRPPMSDVLWDLEHALQLQKIAVPRQPHEDSTNSMTSFNVSLPNDWSLNTQSFPIPEDYGTVEDGDSTVNPAEVFSQLKVGDGR